MWMWWVAPEWNNTCDFALFKGILSKNFVKWIESGQMCHMDLRVVHLVADSIIKLSDILNESTRTGKGI